tara:strand:+ start:2543 stop:2752 length:210 start_codon:yes stop_codon:yes gene_type:complete
MQVVTVRFTGSMVQPSHHDCQIVEGSMQMKFDAGLQDINRPVCKIVSPFGKDNTLEAFYLYENWNCNLD